MKTATRRNPMAEEEKPKAPHTLADHLYGREAAHAHADDADGRVGADTHPTDIDRDSLSALDFRHG